MAFTAESLHGASKSQGSAERVLPWQVTMDQLIFAFLSHTHYWFEVGMLKVPVHYQSNPLLLQVVSFSTVQRCLSSFRRWVSTVFLNIPSFRKRLQAYLDSVTIADTSHSVNSLFTKLLPVQNVVLTHIPGGAPHPSRSLLPLLCSASFSAPALVHAFSVSLLRLVSLILLSF